MKSNVGIPAFVGILAAIVFAAPAIAAPTATLAVGGRTLAGPGRSTIGAGSTATVYTHPAINTDVCTTVINGSTTSTLQIKLVDDSLNETLLEILSGRTGALCENDVVRMDLTCMGGATCTAVWRVDAK